MEFHNSFDKMKPKTWLLDELLEECMVDFTVTGEKLWERMERAVEKVNDRLKLNAFRRKDQVHLLDMISLGMIDQSWAERFPPRLQQRLQELLDDPDG